MQYALVAPTRASGSSNRLLGGAVARGEGGSGSGTGMELRGVEFRGCLVLLRRRAAASGFGDTDTDAGGKGGPRVSKSRMGWMRN